MHGSTWPATSLSYPVCSAVQRIFVSLKGFLFHMREIALKWIWSQWTTSRVLTRESERLLLQRFPVMWSHPAHCRLRLECDGTRAKTRFRLSAKWTGPFKSAEASVQSTTGSRGVRISGSNAGYTMFRGSVKNTGYPLHSPVSSSLPLPRVTMCHHISTGVYPLNVAYISKVSCHTPSNKLQGH
jgi:hypothetical protein